MKNSYHSKLKIAFLLILVILSNSGLLAQVSVTATVGNAGPSTYTSVNAAFTAINAGTHQGVITIALTGNTTEPAAAIPLVGSGTGSASYTSIAIRPSGGNRVIASAATPTSNRGVLELNGADNVTIDGDDPGFVGTRNLTISSSTTTNLVACIRISSPSTTNGATFNTVKNCIITGSRLTSTTTTASYGINVSSYSTTSLLGSASLCNNLIIENNEITRCGVGIHIAGTTSNYHDNLIIRNNILGSSSASTNIGNRGIFIAGTAGTAGTTSALIENNDIRVGDVSISGTNGYSASIAGIEIGTANAGAKIYKNHIHDVYQTSTSGFGAAGIVVSGSTTCNDIEIINNRIVNIATIKYGFNSITSAANAIGIRYSAGATAQKIKHNTILLPEATIGTGSPNFSHGVAFLVSGVTVSEFYNNIVVNRNTGSGTFAIYATITTNISGGSVDGNNYFIGSGGNIGYYNLANQTAFSNWQSATSKDANSYNLNPPFSSASNVSIPAATTTLLESGGVVSSTTGVTTDFEGDARPGPSGSVNGGATKPDVGADEFDGIPVTCFPPIGITNTFLTSNTAIYTWTAPSPAPSNGYLWELRTSGAAGSGAAGLVLGDSTAAGVLTDTFFGLTPNTSYSLYLRGNCGTSQSPWSSQVAFSTPCSPSSMPYFEGFEGLAAANTLPTCFSASPSVAAGGKTQTYIAAGTVTNSALIARTGSKFTAVYWSPSATSGYFFSAPLNLTGGISYDASIFYRTDGVAWTDATLYYGTAANSASMNNTIATVTSAAATTYTKISGSFTPPSSGVYFVAYRAYNATSSPNYCSFDDFEVKMTPTCFEPTITSTTGITATAARINWTAPTSGTSPIGYQWEVRSSGTAGSGSAGLAASGSTGTGVLTDTVTGLLGGNSYSIYVRSICAAGDTSLWTSASGFTTTPVSSASSGDWNVGSTWTSGVVPVCGEGAAIAPGHNVTVNSVGNNVKNLIIRPGGTLTVASGDLTLGCTLNNSFLADTGSLIVTGGTLNINGKLHIHTGATYTQSGGDIIIDGNSGQTANSVPTGQNLVQLNSNMLNLTGGKLTIVDPHAGASTTDYVISYNNGSHYASGTGHTIQYGNATSIDTGGNVNGFYNYFWQGAGYFSAGNVIVNSGNGKNRFVSNTSSIGILGNLTITKGEYQTGTGTVYVAGNVSNADTLTTNGTLAFATWTNGVVSNATVAQTISGAGLFRNARSLPAYNFNNLIVQNNSSTGVTFSPINNLSGLAGFLGASTNGITFNANGRATTATGHALLWGTSTARGTGTLAASNGGMTNGSTFAIGTTTAETGTTITSAVDPSSTLGRFPFVNSSNINRSLYIERSSPSGSGIMAFTYGENAGNSSSSITDGTYNVNLRSNDSFVFSTLGTTPSATSYLLAITANSIFGGTLTADSTRITQAAGVIGTHQRGTVTPTGQRIGLTLANLTSGAFYIGINSNEVPFASAQSGDWNTTSTWNKGAVPGCSDAIFISPNTTVTVSSSGNQARNITIEPSGVLTINSGGLTAGCTNNNNLFRINGGILNMNGGTFTINGKFFLDANSNGRFNQSAGNIIVDANSGVAATSIMPGSHGIAGGHIVDMHCHSATGLNLTGGTFTVIDPAKSTATGDHSFKVYPLPTGINCGSGAAWTLNIGNGSTTANAGGHSSGFLIGLSNSTTTFKLNGPTNVNLRRDSANTWVSTSLNVAFRGDLTITKGDFRNVSTGYFGGNIVNNDTLTNTSVMYLGDYNISAAAPLTVAQTIGGSGVFRNATTSPTANTVSMTVNNTSTSGLTLNVPVTMSGILNMTAGIINSTATNYIQLGIPGVAGTLTGTAFGNTTHINGIFRRAFASGSAGTATLSNVHLMPVGTGGTYLPLWVSPTTTSNVTLRTEAFTSNSGSMGSGVTSLNGNNWECLPLGSGVTGAFVRAGDPSIVSTNLLLSSSSSGGTYNGVAGGSTYTAATAPTLPVVSSSALITPFDGYFGTGDMTLCTAPLAQPSSLAFKYVTNTSVSADFSAASPAPTGYLVVRYPASGTTTAPVDYTTYAVGAVLGTGTVVANVLAAPFTFNATGLTASTTYDFYVYSFSNSGCAGPAYLSSSPLTASITTCAAAISTTGLTLSYNGQTSSGFTLNWTGATTPPAGGAEYVLDLATDPLFTNIVSGFNALNVGPVLTYAVTGLNASTTYWARLRVKEIGTSCTSPAVTTNWTSIATLPASSVSTIFENFDAPAPATTNTVFPGGWYKVTSAGTVNKNTTGSFTAPNSVSISNSATLTSRGTLALPTVTNNTSGSHRARFRMQVSTAGSKMYFGYLTTANDPTTFVRLDSFIPSTTNAEYISVAISTPSGSDVLALQPDGTAITTFYVDNFNWEVVPSCTIAEAGTVSATNSSLCTSLGLGTTIGSSGFSKDSSNLLYTWQTSPNGTTWTNKTTTSPTYSKLTDTPSAQTYYRLIVECVSSTVLLDSSNGAVVSVSNPMVTSTTTDTVCGIGSVTLRATGTDTAFYWYKNPTGGTPLGSKDSFITTISTDSTFYVSNGIGIPEVTFIGDGDWQHNATAGGFQTTAITGACIVLNVSAPTTITSFDMYPSAAVGTNFTVEARSGTTSASSSAITHSFTGTTSVTNSGSPTIAQTVNVNWTFNTPGVYFLGFSSNPNTWRSNPTSCGYPWPLSTGTAEILGSSASGTTTTTQIYQYYLFNFKSGAGCFSSRTPVVAKRLTPPALALDSPSFTICKGTTSASVSVTPATVVNYSTYSWTPTTGVTTPTASSTTFSPSTTMTYTLSATDVTSGCNTTQLITITAADTPSRLTLSQGLSKTQCSARVDSIMASGGEVTQSGVLGSGALSNTLSTPFKRYWGGSKSQALYTPAELTALGLVPGSKINSLGWISNAGTPAAMTDFTIKGGFVSTTSLSAFVSGASSTLFYSASYTPPTGAGNLDYSVSPALIWDGTSHLLIETCFNNNDGGTASTNSLDVQSSTVASGLNLYLSIDNNATVCTSTTAPSSTTTRPNLRLSFTTPAMTWTPFTGLFTDRTATTAYTGGIAAKVYSKPTVTTTYHVQSQLGNCIVKDSIVDSANTSTSMISLANASASGAASQCTDGGWTYYGTVTDPDKFIFAINKGSSGMTGETINLEVLGSNPSSTSSAGINQQHGSYLMKRGWDVTGTVPTGSVSVRFFYDPADTTSVNTDRDAGFAALASGSLAVKTGFEWFKSTGTPYNSAWRALVVGNKFPSSHVKLTPTFGTINGVNYVEFSGITSFSGGSGGSGFGPPSSGGGVGLPVTWAGFDAVAKESGNDLTWKTASEVNTSHFEVEYSYDGINFNKSAIKVPAAGSSQTLKTYTYTHKDVSAFVYYRIKQVDMDSRSDYSATKLVKRTDAKTFQVSVYPIPVLDDQVLNVEVKAIDKSDLFITILDMNGRIVKSRTTKPTTNSILVEKINVSNLSNGLYQVVIQNGQGKEVVKFSK
jgi:hypothetical protein